MIESTVQAFSRTKSDSVGSVHEALAMVRGALEQSGGRASWEQPLNQITETLARLESENEGMANELVNVYEQLGIVFEVTHKLAGVESESDVVDLLVESFYRSFGHYEVASVYLNDNTSSNQMSWLQQQVKRSCDRKTVLVEPVPRGAMPASVSEVMIGPIFAGDSLVCAIVVTRTPDVNAFRASDMNLLESLLTFCGDLIRNHHLVGELRDMSFSMVRSLVSAIDQKDEYTSGHSLRVAYYSTLLARDIGVEGSSLQQLQWSALLHDVGKIGIRDNVLNKPGKLTDEERAHINEHPERSYEVVKAIPQLAGALDGVLHHHERYDGTGYPHGLAGEDIPLQARIIQIADVFDALTSSRSYRSAFDWPKALKILEIDADSAVDARLQQAFDRLMRPRLENHSDGWAKMQIEANAFSETTERRR